ncbi:hypothetical protein Hdeb2414_s0016g00492941 [Helianthus debilis subsp. tardiflorus]
MAGGDVYSSERKLDQTPTWAVAGVCAIILIISIALEKFLHKLGKIFTDKQKTTLFNALEKVKAELMVLGFISLILTFSQYYIAKICIPVDVANTMLPCALKEGKGARRLLLWYEHGRSLAGAATSSCKEGNVPIITVDGLHQLHTHILSSDLTRCIQCCYNGSWEIKDPSRFRLTHETSFVRAHTSFWTRIPVFFYIGCFFRQFFKSIRKSDYMTFRNRFIELHLARGAEFNFQKYIKRSLEDDFQVIVGVSPVLWASFVIFLLLNVNGWPALFWASIIQLVIILAVGTKLQAILTKMAPEIKERHAVVQGISLVLAPDNYFWFSKPRLMLHLIHFVLFQNAFQITYFLWIWYEYKINSCFHDNMKLVILKLVIGVGVLILCSYITLPLYALLSQTGSTMKKSIFDKQTVRGLKKWRMRVKRKHRGHTHILASSLTASPVHSMASPIYPTTTTAATLQRFKTTGHSTHSVAYEDTDASDFEAEALSPESSSTTHMIDPRVDYESDHEIKLDVSTQQVVETRHEEEFSFARSATPLE